VPPATRTFACDAVLFDLDGTLADSIAAVDRAWSVWAREHGLDVDEVLRKIHGRRAIDSLRLLAPHLDVEREFARLRRLEATDTRGVEPVPGALEFARSLPPETWGVVTSGTSDVAEARIAAIGLPRPAVVVYGEEVELGKPDPAPYRLACERIGVPPARCLVFEDAHAGILSAQRAGAVAIGVAYTCSPDTLTAASAMIADFRCVRLNPGTRGLEIALNPL
jgi:mannitol-1-/sugar-/sorbitol-6-phosphatase